MWAGYIHAQPVYFSTGARSVATGAHRNDARLQALWLANCSSVILFYPYLKASFFTPVKQLLGQTMEFKTTLKGGNSSNFSLRTFGPAIIIVVLNIVTFSVGLARFDVNINAAKSISLCWIVFNTLPHLVLLLHAYWGPGVLLVTFCKLFMLLTNASGVLAIVLMWLLYPREVKFVEPLAASIKLMQARFRPHPPFPSAVGEAARSCVRVSFVCLP